MLPGGPWGLISMQAVIATAPAAPFPAGEDRCQTLPGPTMWNLSGVPSLNTSLWGGRALFWQLVFYNDSGSMVFGSVINSSVVVDGPYDSASYCVSYLENAFGGLYESFPSSYWFPNGTFSRGLLMTLAQLNSESWAPTAASHLGNASLRVWGGIVTYYTLGYSWLNLVDWGPQAWLVWNQACGIPGRSGDQPYAETGWGLNSSPSTYYGPIAEGQLSCPVSTRR